MNEKLNSPYIYKPSEHEQNSSSRSGFHFYNLYQCCPWKFYLRYVLSIKPQFTAAPLIFGAAFHKAKEVWYNTLDRKKAIETAKNEITRKRDEFAYEDAFIKAEVRCPILIEHWIDEWGEHDQKFLNVFAVEIPLRVPLVHAPDKCITMRIDALAIDRDGLVIVLETKTSSYSINTTKTALETGDQATCYTYGVRRAFPKFNFYGVQADIAYWNKQAKHEKNIACVRPEIVIRSDSSLAEFDAAVSSTMTDITNRVMALDTHPAAALFPRNTQWCTSYNKKCEYAEICRDIDYDVDMLPVGFVFDRVPHEVDEKVALQEVLS